MYVQPVQMNQQQRHIIRGCGAEGVPLGGAQGSHRFSGTAINFSEFLHGFASDLSVICQ